MPFQYLFLNLLNIFSLLLFFLLANRAFLLGVNEFAILLSHDAYLFNFVMYIDICFVFFHFIFLLMWKLLAFLCWKIILSYYLVAFSK